MENQLPFFLIPLWGRTYRMAVAAEIELKFLFAERDTAKIKALVSAASGAKHPVRQRLRAIYFDTPNQDLWKHGFTLRVRASGESHIQTVKQMTSSGIHRGEWEQATDKLEPDLDLVKDTPLAGLAAKSSIGGALKPAFQVNVERTSYRLEASGGVIEASLDRGAIEADGEKLGVRELELELKSGGPRALYNLARAFVSQAPLHPSVISKAERGHHLTLGTWGCAAKGPKPRLQKDMTCRNAFQEICRTCLHDFHLNIAELEKRDNAEAVHQARIAIRRLRAAMALFNPIVMDIAYRKLRGGLKWLAGSFGAARDLDVLLENLLPRAAWDQAANDLARRCEAGRLRARQTAIEALNSERARILLFDLAVWIEGGRWQRQSSGIAGKPIQSFAGRSLKKRHKKLVRRGADLAHLSPGPRHKVRIKAKELRYMAEFFADVPGVTKDRRRLKKLTGYCEKLQESLGAIRDQEAVSEFIRRGGLANTAASNAAAKTAILVQGHPQRADAATAKDLKKAVRAYSRLAGIKAF